MKKLDFSKSSKSSLDRLTKAQNAIDNYSKAHPKQFTDSEHKEFRALLNERSAALSEAMGTKVHSLFGD